MVRHRPERSHESLPRCPSSALLGLWDALGLALCDPLPTGNRTIVCVRVSRAVCRTPCVPSLLVALKCPIRTR